MIYGAKNTATKKTNKHTHTKMMMMTRRRRRRTLKKKQKNTMIK